jgi:hypothetical protein
MRKKRAVLINFGFIALPKVKKSPALPKYGGTYFCKT